MLEQKSYFSPSEVNTLLLGRFLLCRDPAGARTQDPLIKSQMLYQLSYGILLLFKKASANLRPYFLKARINLLFSQLFWA